MACLTFQVPIIVDLWITNLFSAHYYDKETNTYDNYIVQDLCKFVIEFVTVVEKKSACNCCCSTTVLAAD